MLLRTREEITGQPVHGEVIWNGAIARQLQAAEQRPAPGFTEIVTTPPRPTKGAAKAVRRILARGAALTAGQIVEATGYNQGAVYNALYAMRLRGEVTVGSIANPLKGKSQIATLITYRLARPSFSTAA